ncbi:glycoside hydrolase family 32 protein [Cucurbitaria berberidis CBS 394.84]|uniref:Glycoside hydrolase family 32 protein n=1 Tax=Cucurbitaria berberidis CBS 394.84 TaxID=1168544 RepID=A0A9P4GEK4_9PLEO|nr:glycoside hydrolase family 32 protein [Cucurbitaria berberidis CBS 394.84]KAF1843775.1 glycoside hydrolase family 32 protein [Cucurbitaria berberidis CBS 394.84]
MFWSIPLLSLALGYLPSARAHNDTGSTLPAILSTDIIEGLGNNSLFTRWRPTYHFTSPAGWMNDPCAMLYDPTTDTYHLHYQWHPNHVNWGNISWGHATSKDLITWTDVGGWENDQAQSVGTGPGPDSRNNSYYGLGIFSGSGQPYNLQGEQDGTLINFYTSVQHLPTNWALPYIKGTEKQSIVISNDGGKTWEQYEGNPVISSPPEGWNITGWRDPFVEPWPEMDAILGQKEPHWYMVLGSGIKGEGGGGRIPFYSAPSSNLTDWTFLGALWEPDRNETLGSLLETGTYGFNFEVSNFFSLTDEDDDVHYYVLMGAEGGNLTWHPRASWGLWNEGVVTRRENGSAEFTPVSGGVIDSGLLYAVTSFNDTKNDRRVQWGWASEENNNYAINQQGFQGAMAIPREMYVIKTRDLINADGGLSTKGNTRVVEHSNGTFTGYTLGARPLPDVVEGLHVGAEPQNIKTAGTCNASLSAGNASSHMHLQVTLSNFTGPAGVTIAMSPGREEQTTIWYSPENYTINVDRSKSSLIGTKVANYTMLGYFYPYTFSNGTQESLHMDVFVDGSLVEVIVNDRFWLTTRIYPARTDSTGFGVWVGDNSTVHATDLTVWNIAANAFPDRPANSSSELVFDTPEESNNYVWWAGN